VDFVRYAELAAALVNAPLETEADVAAHLADRQWLRDRLEPRDLMPLVTLQDELRAVFEASDAGEETDVVALMNTLLAVYPVSPRIAGHDSATWHLHVAEKGSSVSALVTAECLMGLAMLVVDYGPTRLGVCSAERCSRVFVDTSPNSSRRYCSERCSSRANVAAYRARRKAEAHV
jgi:predicted RNA-binding Zn ribbon-like protein